MVISSRAHPPADIVEKALDLRTPPSSPRLRAKQAAAPSDIPALNEPSAESFSEVQVPSSSATETTPPSSMAPDTPIPGSPLSSHTSVSMPAAPSSPSPHAKQATSPAAPASTLPQAQEVSFTTSAPSVEGQQALATDNVQPVPESSVTASSATSSAPSDQAKPAVPPPKKSWASLLQSSDAAASSSKSRLPISSVVGFSIPAGIPNGTPAQPTAPVSHVRPELANLLNAGPAGHAPPLKICPRGLINSGNMCFANAVLQVLVYCAPFRHLFSELSKHLLGPVVGSQKEGSRATPLVDATIEFLKEFDQRESAPDFKVKGKEREEDFDELESFIPTYVYDVLKEKKRFASMVVSVFGISYTTFS